MQRFAKAQGATEYLVLLAVVLIIALVGVALLGFFPGTANDAQIQESQVYWQSASPVAITEMAIKGYQGDSLSRPYLRIRNTGAYPLRITGLVGGDGVRNEYFWSGGGAPQCGTPSAAMYRISDFFYMAPGEESYFIWWAFGSTLCERTIDFNSGASSGGNSVGGASSLCQNSTQAPGTFVINKFGFEYIQYVEGQQITKRQMGTKPLIIKCGPPY